MADRALATAFVNIVPGTVDLERYLKTQLAGDIGDAGVGAGAGLAKGVGSGFGSKIKGFIAPALATMAASFGVIQVGGFLKDAISNASDFAEQGAAVGQVFGDASGVIQAFAAAGATSLGQSKTQVLDAAKTFGIYGKAAGLAGEDNALFSTGMVTLATDLASFNNTSVDEAIQAIGSGLRGEAEPLRRFGVLLDDATLKQAYFNETGQKVTGTLTPQQKVLAAHAAIMEQTATQQGDFARTSGGLANQQRILTANMENLGITVGTALLPVLTTLVTFTNENLLPGLGSAYEWFQKYGYIVGIVAGALLTIFMPAIITSMVAAVGAWLSASGAAIASSASQLIASYKTIGGWVMQGIAATVNAAKTVAGWVVSAAAAVAGAASFLVQTAFVIGGWVAQGIAATVNAAKVVLGWVITAAGAVANAAIFLVQTAIVIGGWVLMGVQSLIQAARMAAAWLIAMGPIGWVIAAVVGLVAIIIANWDNIKKFTVKAWDAIVAWVKQAAQWMIDVFLNWTLLGIIIKNWDNIVAFIGGLPAKFMAMGKNIIDGLINGVKAAAGGIGDFFGDIANNAIEGFKSMMGIHSPSKVFQEFGRNIIQGLNKGLTGDVASINSSMKKVTEWVAAAFKDGKITASAKTAANAIIKSYTVALNALARKHAKVVADLEKAQTKLTDLLKEKSDYIDSMKAKFGSALNIQDATSAGDAMKQLQDRIAKNKELLAILTDLKAAGLSDNLYKQVLESGNIDFAKSIQAGGAETITQLNSLAAEADATANALATTAGGVLFDQGIQVAQGIVDGLKAKKKALEDQMKSLADKFTERISSVISRGAVVKPKTGGGGGGGGSTRLTGSQGTVASNDAHRQAGVGTTTRVNTTSLAGILQASGIPLMAKGGFVSRPTQAIIGEAGPEVVTPLKDFERMMGIGSGSGQTLNYYAAPNQSLDSEQALFTAMKRGKVVAGW